MALIALSGASTPSMVRAGSPGSTSSNRKISTDAPDTVIRNVSNRHAKKTDIRSL
ncbi:uncharacterized protein METZ01_LOCUS120342 [marine metagenome]|uniref:Uncharacterized protein n=1 Tax=marine metagenome TaxID=408172 RepID=A0A381XRZ4_9ZZZZ